MLLFSLVTKRVIRNPVIARGIKTKMLEAFAHGKAVISNVATFEAMPLVSHPLQIEVETGLLAIRRYPEAHRASLEEAACAGVRYRADYYIQQCLSLCGIKC
jgi:hypothetical protein